MLSVVFTILGVSGALARGIDDDLLRIALKVFPRTVAVDLDIAGKLTPDGKVLLVLFYQAKHERAEAAVQKSKADYKSIADYPVKILSTDKLTQDTPTAIMLMEDLDDVVFKQLLDYCTTHGIILFSPYEEDVRRGATAGISIETRIKPYFNKTTLERSGITINEIVLRSSRVEE